MMFAVRQIQKLWLWKMPKSLLLWPTLFTGWSVWHPSIKHRKDLLPQMWRRLLPTIKIPRKYPFSCFIHTSLYATMLNKEYIVWFCFALSLGEYFYTMLYLCLLCFNVEKKTDIDGAYFGTTFPHLFLMTYGHLKPQKAAQSYVPRVFGFKLHKPWRKERRGSRYKEYHAFWEKQETCGDKKKKEEKNACLYHEDETSFSLLFFLCP